MIQRLVTYTLFMSTIQANANFSVIKRLLWKIKIPSMTLVTTQIYWYVLMPMQIIPIHDCIKTSHKIYA